MSKTEIKDTLLFIGKVALGVALYNGIATVIRKRAISAPAVVQKDN